MIAQYKELGEKIRAGRGSFSQQYIALRLLRTKSWLSRVESGQLCMNADQLGDFGKLVKWSEEELSEAFALLGSRQTKGKQQVMATIKSQLETLQALVGNEGMASAIVGGLRNMDPPMWGLEFLRHELGKAVVRAKQGR